MPEKRPPARAFGAHTSIAGGVSTAVKRAGDIGAEALQIFTRNQVRWASPPLSEEETVAFRSAYEASNLRFLCAHASYLINLASPSKRLRAKSLGALIDEVRRADTLGCGCLVMHPGSPKYESTRRGLARIASALGEALEHTRECRVGIALENTAGQGSNIGGHLWHLSELIGQAGDSPRLGLCLDTCHAWAAGWDLRHPHIVRELADSVRRGNGGDRLWLLHMNDSVAAVGSHRDRHAAIGEGEIGLAGFRNILHEPLLSEIPAILETPKENDPAAADRKNLAVLRDLQSHPPSATTECD